MISGTSARLASTDGSVTFKASSALMDDYGSESDLTGETDVISIAQADGSYSLLYIGATGNVMALRQDPLSDTGWTEEALGNGFPAGQVTGIVDGTGLFSVFATGPNVAAPDLYVSSRVAGSWTTWQPVSVDNSVPPFMTVNNLAAFAFGEQAQLFVLLGPSPNTSGPGSVWLVNWQAEPQSWVNLGDTDQQVLASCNITGYGPGILLANTSAANPTLLDLLLIPAPFTGDPVTLAGGVWFTSLATGRRRTPRRLS